MTFKMKERDIKEKWLKQYQDEISTHIDRKEKERLSKLEEEQEYLNKIKKDLQAEQFKINDWKKKVENDYVLDYDTRINERCTKMERKPNTENVSLDLKSEERLQEMKNNFNKLTEKVDQNMNNYVEYQKKINNFQNSYSNKLQQENEAKINQNFAMNNINNISSPETKFYNKDQLLNNIRYEIPPMIPNRLDYIANRNYMQYKEILQDYNNYNKSLISNKHRTQEYNSNEKKKLNEERLKELDNLNSIQIFEKQSRDKTQSIYKDLLEDQINAKATSRPGLNWSNYNNMSNQFDYDYIVKNVSSIKPYSYNKRYDLGNTDLEVNTILNPVHNYKHNKYLYASRNYNYNTLNREFIDNKGSRLQFAGNSIIK